MTPSTRVRMVRALAVGSGAAAGVVGGAVAGGWWWAAGLMVVVAAIGSVRDRMLGHAHAVATLVLAAGAVSAGSAWVVPLLVGGFVASLELHAVADRVTVVRPQPALGPVAPTLLAVVALTAAVAVVGAATDGLPALGGVVAGVAAVAALRVIAR